MADRKTSSIEYFALGFVAGMAVGAAVALLTAPKSGRLLRRDLKRGIEDASESMKGKVEERVTKIQDGLREVEQALKDAAQKITPR
jgi:gas vesicle protein